MALLRIKISHKERSLLCTIKGGECWLLARNRQTLYGAGNLTKEPGYESKGNKYYG